MGIQLFPRAYDELIDEDIAWLKEAAGKDNPSLELRHILVVLEKSKEDYRASYGSQP